MNDIVLSIAEQIKEYMKVNNLSQNKLAKQLGIKQPQVNTWLKGVMPRKAWQELFKIKGIIK